MERTKVPALMCIIESSQLVYQGMVGITRFSEDKKPAEQSTIHPFQELVEGKLRRNSSKVIYLQKILEIP